MGHEEMRSKICQNPLALISCAGRRMKNFLSRTRIFSKNPRHVLTILLPFLFFVEINPALFFFLFIFSHHFFVLSRKNPFCKFCKFCLGLIRSNWHDCQTRGYSRIILFVYVISSYVMISCFN